MKLPLTVPVQSIVLGALRTLNETKGMDRDEAYLLARLEDGENLADLIRETEDL